VTGLRLKQNLKLQDTDLESLSYQGFGVAMQLLNHREDAMDVVQESLRKLVHGGQFNGKLGTHRSWFLKVVRNGSLDVLRRRKPTTRKPWLIKRTTIKPPTQQPSEVN